MFGSLFLQFLCQGRNFLPQHRVGCAHLSVSISKAKCIYLFFTFITFIGVTLFIGSHRFQVCISVIHDEGIALCAHTQSQISFCHHIFGLFTLYYPPPMGVFNTLSCLASSKNDGSLPTGLPGVELVKELAFLLNLCSQSFCELCFTSYTPKRPNNSD